VRGGGVPRGAEFRGVDDGDGGGGGVEALIDFALDEWRPRVIHRRRRPCARETFFPPFPP